MSRRAKIWLSTGSTGVLFGLFAWLGTVLVDPAGAGRWILPASVSGLGLGAAFVVHRYLSRILPQQAPQDDAEERVDEALAEAEARLAGAQVPSSRIGRLPTVLVLGPAGSAKTSVVEHSGVEAELLAGEVMRGDTIAPTEGLNVWLADRTLFVEAGGGILERPGAWSRLADRLRPDRLAAVVGRGRQAPRSVVVCVSCEELTGSGGPDALTGRARELRERLRALARELGVQLPVYVVFTKADRLPHFEDYVGQLTDAEAREALGATLPLAGEHGAAYADRQSARLSRRFDELADALARRRVEVLQRAGGREESASAYEFPRELRKVRDPAVGFLVELCRPTQLGVGPFLRGFYFSGVRPVVVEEAQRASSAPDPERDRGGVGATMVFDPGAATEPRAAPSSRGGSRRVPQWVFLDRLFREVLLGDTVAREVTGGGARVDLGRRALVGAGLALAATLLIGTTVSFFGNRSLAGDTLETVAEVEHLASAETSTPSATELAALDSLGAQIGELRSHQTDGTPWSLGWGLYTGSDLLSAARSAYFARFEPMLGRPARIPLLRELRQVAESPEGSGDYGAIYERLKAYLILTSRPDESSADFLGPVLTRHWLAGRDVDSTVADLARDQFELYGSELRFGDPYDLAPEEELVSSVRSYLTTFTQAERFYQTMIAGASEARDAVRLTEVAPGSGNVVRASHVVPGAFTADGWEYVQANLDDVGEILDREDWVTGGQSFSEDELAALADSLERRYVSDYLDHWEQFIRTARVVGFSNPRQAASSLRRLSDNSSPLLLLLDVAARNTRVGSEIVDPAFQPVRVVLPPDSVDRFVGESNRALLDALGRLQSSVEEVSSATGSSRQQALTRAGGDADQVTAAVRELTRDFSVEGRARVVGQAVADLLEAPGLATEQLVRRLPAAEANARAREFCASFSDLTSRYPFQPGASESASIEDLDAALQPGGSLLWSFYDETLSDLLALQGDRYRPRSGASPQPSEAFVAFFNRAASISEAFYGSDGADPTVEFVLRLETSDAAPEVTVDIDGQTQSYTRTFSAGRPFRWEGSRARSARITGVVDGSEVTLLEVPEGTWALFRLLGRADWEASGGEGRYRLRWPVPGRQITLEGELTLGGGAPILNPAYLSGLDCVSSVAR